MLPINFSQHQNIRFLESNRMILIDSLNKQSMWKSNDVINTVLNECVMIVEHSLPRVVLDHLVLCKSVAPKQIGRTPNLFNPLSSTPAAG